MFCHQCGKEVGDAKFCPYCGTQLQGADMNETNSQNYTQDVYQTYNQTNTPVSEDAPSGGFAVLSFFIPIVGIILYIVWYKEFPLKAKSCLKGFVAGIITYLVIVICMVISVFVLVADNADDYDRYYHNYPYFNAIVETVPYE